ncbi:MAG: DUF4870 domain-containing protein [Acidobacteriota bacterium]
MLVLSYLGLLALIPLLVEKEDPEVQWHAKNGLVFFISWIALSIMLSMLSYIPALGPLLGCVIGPILWLGILAIHIIAMVKAINGERLRLPVISDFTDRWQ